MRMNISVPDDLAEQVRALDLPISGICQRALGEAVTAAERRAKFADDLDAVADRLRGTVDLANHGKRVEGRRDGIIWAKEYASVRDLTRLADGESDGIHPQSPSLLAFKSAQTGQNVVSVDIDLDDDEPYWDGFMAGAMEVWEAVYDRV